MCYSGDTRPSKHFEEASSNCNLMIHESTYNDHEKSKAINHLHSTVSDALTV
jgi:ribonuclease Z